MFWLSVTAGLNKFGDFVGIKKDIVTFSERYCCHAGPMEPMTLCMYYKYTKCLLDTFDKK